MHVLPPADGHVDQEEEDQQLQQKRRQLDEVGVAGLDGQKLLLGRLDELAPGQAAVFYRGDEVLGGGTISEAVR